MASKKSKASVPKVSKSEFIRARMDKAPKQVKAEAKAAGISISDAMIYSVRAETKKKGGASSKGKPGRKPKGGAPPGYRQVHPLESIIREICRQEIKAFFAKFE